MPRGSGMLATSPFAVPVFGLAGLALASGVSCGSSSSSGGTGGSASAQGGSLTTGGNPTAQGGDGTGGVAAGGAGSGSGGNPLSSGGALTSGGAVATGGAIASGGVVATGGALASGGTSSGTGGTAGRGGVGSGGIGTGGALSSGGGNGKGGAGGVSTAGASSAGTSSGGAAGAATACVDFAAPVALGKAEPSTLSTLSGLVASRAQPGVLYAHADRSGPRFFALTKAGHALGDFSLTGVQATDWEDCAIGPGPAAGSYLYFGDIGDNTARPGTGSGRAEIQVYRVREPTVSLTQTSTQQNIADFQRMRFTYPDRPHDSETLMIDPANGDYIIVTREADGSAVVFQAPGSTPPDMPKVLSRLASFQIGAEGANAGDISPTGDRALVRSYEAALLFVRAPGATWATAFGTMPRSLLVANEAQSEGATFGADGRSWLSSGEVDPTIYEAKATCP
ncbi:MAG TPA: hypothetical protein VG937_05925 [Polyangiaceae bacterium]|nr:hypothetical protein [Polyangiaceae bacterium]